MSVCTLQHTFTRPKGLLFATQFAQVALVIMSRAALRSKGFVQPDAGFAGHSLGEYSALASVADILPNSSFVDVVVLSWSDYAASYRARRAKELHHVCCYPSHVSKTFDDAGLREVVDTISNVGDRLLETVNFNVEVRS
jgi:fatty acid synthase subunit beta